MALSVVYFARLRETLGLAHEEIAHSASLTTVAELLDHLRGRGGCWQEALASQRLFRVAVNQEMADAAMVLKDGDEVALFPPVTGG
jgi:molybdopterin synthase sulfur carrier subunit